MKQYSVVSLFSGCGGMDLGLKGGFDFLGQHYARNRFDITWANDLNRHAGATYEYNMGHKIHVGSIWDQLHHLPGECDLLAGGFPCQDISVNGKRRGIAGARSGLYRAMVEAVGISKPKMFIAENVKGLLYDYNKESLRTVIADFSSLGYAVSYDLYLAADYGVPQMRERVIIVGVQDGRTEFRKPAKTCADPMNRTTSKQAIQDLAAREQDAAINHVWSLARKTANQGGRSLNAAKPAPTIRAECHGNNPFHYELPRRISMREAARFQSFPDNFIFKAGLRETERMIGNAVPPVLAWHIAQAAADALDRLS